MMPRSGVFHRLPCLWRYPLVGFLLAQGAPWGLLVLRAALQRGLGDVGWLLQQLSEDWATYVYLTVSTSAVFVVLGLYLGAKQDSLRTLAATDGLTGLRNRRYFRDRLCEELDRARRYHAPLALLLVDLDWLKVINDRHGHGAGDRALLTVARTLRQNLRASDVVARYAGDEFVALLPQTTAHEAVALADRVAEAVRADQINSETPLSVSCGVADLDTAAGDSGEELFGAADEALYAAKAAGRDGIVAAPKLQAA